ERMLAHVDGGPAPDMASWPEGYSVYMAAFGLGDFPGFLQAPSPVAGLSEHAPGVQCTAYSRPDGARVIVCRATQDAAIADHAYDGDGYVAVTEGAFEMKFHGGGITLKPGMEFHIPHGLHWSGKVTAGTRFVLGLGVPGKKG
ncbi:MAG TPA: hypothetical protein VF678_14475, partial [bacterium]